MAGGLAIGYRQIIMQYFAGKAGLTQPSAWYVSLHTGDPGDTGTTANEASGGGYARVQINGIGGSSPAWADVTSASPNVLANANAITFPTSSGAISSGSNITWFGIQTASSAGTQMARGQITSPSGGVSVNSAGITLSFAIGNLVLNIDHT